jgi:predicted flap endonuclease-1-like 5' DNA nuclease
MRNPPILIAVLGFFALLAGFGFLFLGLRLIGFDWFGLFGDLPALEQAGIMGWLALATGVVWLLAGLGLWTLQPWARLFVMVMAGFALLEAAIATFQFPGVGLGLGMAVMPAIILWYLTTAEVKAAFAEALDRLGSDAAPAPAPVARPIAAQAPVAAPAFAGAAAVAATAGVADRPSEPAAPVVDRPSEPAAPVVAAAVAAPEPVSDPAPAVAPEASSGSARAIKVVDVEGIGAAYSDTLGAAGVSTTDDLLAVAGTRAGRQRLAERTGISEHLILEWVNNADLMRIPGVGTQYSDLLEAAGVDSPAELAQRNAGNLATTFQEVVAARPGTVRRVPTEAEVADWIEAARNLAKVVEH